MLVERIVVASGCFYSDGFLQAMEDRLIELEALEKAIQEGTGLLQYSQKEETKNVQKRKRKALCLTTITSLPGPILYYRSL